MLNNTSTPGYLNEKEAAKFLSVSVALLRKRRMRRLPPRFTKFGAKLVRYAVGDLKTWADKSTVEMREEKLR